MRTELMPHDVSGTDYLELVDGRKRDISLFAPLTDSMFGASAAGKEWISDATLDDQIAVAQRCGYTAAFVQGATPDLTVNPGLIGLVETERVGESKQERRYQQRIATPRGELCRELVEQPQRGITAVSDWLTAPEQFAAAAWICEDILSGARDAQIRAYYRGIVDKTNAYGVTQIQLELPFFLFGLAGYATGPVMLCMDENSGYAEIMTLAEQALLHVADLLLSAGVDFLWIGAGGSELLSPAIWEKLLVPQAWRMTRYVHERGGRIHFHCCGQSRLWVERGYFNQIGMDVLETLAPPPVGTIDHLADVRAQLDASIVTRGNIDLELIRTGTPDECAAAVRRVRAATKGYAHLVSGADAILYGTPEDNLRAMVAACSE